MILKLTKTIIPVLTNRATTYKELEAAGWPERELCLKFSDDQQAFTWNSKIKTVVEQEHLRYTTADGKVAYRDWPAEMTPAMVATAKQFLVDHPNSFERFSSEGGISKGWLDRAAKSTIIVRLAVLKGAKREEAIAEFEKAKGFAPTVENIAAAMKRDFEAAQMAY